MRSHADIDDRSVTRRGLGPTGALLMALGIWAGFIPFVGPYFNYQMQTTQPWDMTSDHFWLSILPAIAIFVGGWLIARAFRSGTASLGGLLAFAGSFWLVIGPHFAQLWKAGGQVGGGPAFGGTGVQVGEWLGFFYAAGALGILLSAYAMGYFAALPHAFGRARDRHYGTATAAGAGAGAVAASPRDDRIGPDGQPVERERISDTRAATPVDDRTAVTHTHETHPRA